MNCPVKYNTDLKLTPPPALVNHFLTQITTLTEPL